MNLLELKTKIKSHILAGYPGLYLHSGEESRVDTLLQEISTELTLYPKEWNLGYGWVDFRNKQPRNTQSQDTELAESLPSLLDDDLDGKLFIIKDARSALENQPLAVARLKQLLNRIQRHHRSKTVVVLVSETLHIPVQIESQITLLPLSLPQGEEINQQLSSFCQMLDLFVPENMHQRLHTACCGLNQEEIRSVLALVRQQHEQINDEALALIQHGKEQIIAKSGVLEMLHVIENATDIGGLENLKTWLTRRAQIFRRLSEARDSRVQAPKGVLIAGMPGCGKSLAAKAASGLFQLPLLRLDIGSLLGKYVGESEHNMRRALTMAESISPCILWIDELEKAFVGMNSGSGSEVSSRLFGYFLTWMQEKTGAVFVIATANNITVLPPELLRKGRFDEVFYVGFPNGVERAAILDIHLKGESLELTQNERNKLVTQCRDYAGADIQNAINEAREIAFLENRQLELKDLEAAIQLTVPLRETLREQVAQYEELFEKLKLKPASTSDGLSVAQMIQMADSANSLRRAEVANSEDCPDDLLEKLAADADLNVRKAVYRNPNCPEQVLTQRINIVNDQPEFEIDLLHLACMHANAPHDLMATQFERLQLTIQHRLQLASNSTDSTLLQHLMRDPELDVCEMLITNKNLSKLMQLQLAKDSRVSIRRRLARNSNLHPEAQEILARDRDFTVREDLADLDGLSETVQQILTLDSDQDVRETLAKRRREGLLAEAVQLALAKDECTEVRESLASNPNLTATAQIRLTQDTHVSVRRKLAEHPNLSNPALNSLLKDTDEVLRELAGSKHFDTALLQNNLSQHPSEKIRIALASNYALHPEVQEQLTKDSCTEVRETLAGNTNIADDTICTLMDDSDDDVRARLVHWRNSLPEKAIHHLAMDQNHQVRKSLAYTENLPSEVQQRLANDIYDVQKELASNSTISALTQQQLLDNGNQEVHYALAGNRNLTGPIMAQLAEMHDSEIRAQLARNNALTAPIIGKLIKDEEEVQLALALNQHLNEEYYTQLYDTGSAAIRENLAGNPQIGEPLMERIYQTELAVNSLATAMENVQSILASMRANSGLPSTKSVSKIALALAGNSALSETLQNKILNLENCSVEILEALASNPALSRDGQEELVTHKEANVRQKLAANQNTNTKILHELLLDDEDKVRIALLRDWWTDREIEWQLANDKSVKVRCAVAASQSPGKAVQVKLANDRDQRVRAHLIPEEENYLFTLNPLTQTLLARDSDLSIRQKMASYPKLHPSAQLILVEDDAICVREALARGSEGLFNSPLSEEVQHRLIKDNDFRIRLALAKNKRLTPEVQILLAKDIDNSVKRKLIEESDRMNPLSLLVQEQLANDPDVTIRSDLARCLFSGLLAPRSSQKIRLRLANDPNEAVRDIIIKMGLFELTYSSEQYNDAVLDGLLVRANHEQMEMINLIREKNRLAVQ